MDSPNINVNVNPHKRNATVAGLTDGMRTDGRRPRPPPSTRTRVFSANSQTNPSLWRPGPGNNHVIRTSLSSSGISHPSMQSASSTNPSSPPAPLPVPSNTLARRPTTNSTRSSTVNQNQELTPDQAEIFHLLQQDDPSDHDVMLRFVKGSVEYKLTCIMKGLLHNKRELAQLKKEAKATKRDAELRAIIRPIIRQRLTLERYKDSTWSDPKRVLISLRTHLPADLVLPENAAAIVGKVRIEEKAKLKERLHRCREFVNHPLADFAECLRSEIDSDTKHVEVGVPLFEAAACWRYVVLEMGQAREGNFWSAVDKILAPVDEDWDFYTPDVEAYGHTFLGDGPAFDPNNNPLDPTLAGRTSADDADYD